MSALSQGADGGLARAAGRVHELAHDLVVSAAAAQRDVKALEAALERGRDVPDGGLSADLDAARLVAIELADAGRSREEVERHLRGAFAIGSLEGVLEDVFGPARETG